MVPDLSFIEAGRSFAYLAVFAGAIAAARLTPTASPVLLRSVSSPPAWWSACTG